MSKLRHLPKDCDVLQRTLSEILTFEANADRALIHLQRFPAFQQVADRLSTAAHNLTMMSMDAKLVSNGVRLALPYNVSYLRMALSGSPVILSQVESATVTRYYRALVRYAMEDLHNGAPPITVQDLKTARDTSNLPQLHAWYLQLVVAPDSTDCATRINSSTSLALRRKALLFSSPMMQLLKGWISSSNLSTQIRVARAAAVVETVARKLEAECSAPMAAYDNQRSKE